jgi:regulator of protease activity HflC (stomatin/prohibitin superfamily)
MSLSRLGSTTLATGIRSMSSASVNHVHSHIKKRTMTTEVSNEPVERNVRRWMPMNTVVKFVPHQEAWIVERFGKFDRILKPGLNFMIPLVEKIKYVQSLKELALTISPQSAITGDNVSLKIDRVLFFQVHDPYKASYGVDNHEYALTQLAQTAMRSEIGKIELDEAFKIRRELNEKIVQSMNNAVKSWGLTCLRYEIRDMHMPEEIATAMQLQSSAERKKRAQILDSEGTRQAHINIADGKKTAIILSSEATMTEKINLAKGDAEATVAKAKAMAEGLNAVAKSIQAAGGGDAVSMTIAEKYLTAFEKLAKEGNTILLPANVSDPASMVTQAMSIFKGINKT